MASMTSTTSAEKVTIVFYKDCDCYSGVSVHPISDGFAKAIEFYKKQGRKVETMDIQDALPLYVGHKSNCKIMSNKTTNAEIAYSPFASDQTKLTPAQAEVIRRMKEGYRPSCSANWQTCKGLIKRRLIKADYGNYILTDKGRQL